MNLHMLEQEQMWLRRYYLWLPFNAFAEFFGYCWACEEMQEVAVESLPAWVKLPELKAEEPVMQQSVQFLVREDLPAAGVLAQHLQQLWAELQAVGPA